MNFQVRAFNLKKDEIERLTSQLKDMQSNPDYAAVDMSRFTFSVWPEGVVVISEGSMTLARELAEQGLNVYMQGFYRVEPKSKIIQFPTLLKDVAQDSLFVLSEDLYAVKAMNPRGTNLSKDEIMSMATITHSAGSVFKATHVGTGIVFQNMDRRGPNLGPWSHSEKLPCFLTPTKGE